MAKWKVHVWERLGTIVVDVPDDEKISVTSIDGSDKREITLLGSVKLAMEKYLEEHGSESDSGVDVTDGGWYFDDQIEPTRIEEESHEG